MGIFTDEIQKTSVSSYIEKLSNLDEIDWYILPQLIESIQMQVNGAPEAIETIRKKLKHGDKRQKLRVLEVLKLLTENLGGNFRGKLTANEKMMERIEFTLSDPNESPEVKKELFSIVAANFKNSSTMMELISRYGPNRDHVTRPRANTDGVNRIHTQPPSSPTTSRAVNSPVSSRYTSSPTQEERRKSLPPSTPTPPVVNNPPSTNRKSRSQSSAASTTPTRSTNSDGPQRVFNFEKAKPKIVEKIALGNSYANNLVNALRRINTTEDRWEIKLQRDTQLEEIHKKCEESKKHIVHYARLVEDEEWIGTLLATNEILLKALEMYNAMSVGEIPAALSPTSQHQDQEQLQKAIEYSSRPPPLQIEQGFEDLRLTRKEEDDPFADPDTPIEDEHRGEYIY